MNEIIEGRYRYQDENGRHLHTLDGKPLVGCTTALSIMNKELTWWASGKALEGMGWAPLNKDRDGKPITKSVANEGRMRERYLECLALAETALNKIKVMAPVDYLRHLGGCYRNHSVFVEGKAQAGTDAHELCELWIKSVMAGNEIPHSVQIDGIVQWCRKNVRRFLWSEAHCYSEELWVGGISDFGYEDMNGNYVLADIKNRNTWYSSDFFQSGGYDIMMTSNKAGFDRDGKVRFRLDKPFKAHAVFPLIGFTEPEISFNVEGNRNAYRCALGLYKENQFIKGVK